ncbi:hypothetical protein ACN4EG_25125 [Alkalinema pantanalense CENA528]|uniref:hypothetical protein n=1 Tax=Alkalinema pantanalense TaxID=1620705 RepID=UPI003D6F7A06
MHNDLWQGNCTPWQARFIEHNSLMLGYQAWSGYLQHGGGLLVCDGMNSISPAFDWDVEVAVFDPIFVARSRVPKYLRSLELEPEIIDVVNDALSTYDPAQEIVLLLHGNQAVEINLLQNLAISPPQCYSQVQRRWAEFQPSVPSYRRSL